MEGAWDRHPQRNITEIKKDSSNQMSFYINAFNFYNPDRCQELGH